MNEFVKFECACDVGYDKGALKKTIENNIFTIFGNLHQKSTIVIRYHGILTDTDCPAEYNMFYFFDDHPQDKIIIKLKKCNKCSGECYCSTIDLGDNTSISFGFFNDTKTYELNNNMTFNLKIVPDPISHIMQRYGFEQNTNLPICEEKSCKTFSFKNILNNIKTFFISLIKKEEVI